MAALANTYMTTQAVGNREELSDVVSRITPEDTPIYSLIEKGKCVSIHPELRAAVQKPATVAAE